MENTRDTPAQPPSHFPEILRSSGRILFKLREGRGFFPWPRPPRSVLSSWWRPAPCRVTTGARHRAGAALGNRPDPLRRVWRPRGHRSLKTPGVRGAELLPPQAGLRWLVDWTAGGGGQAGDRQAPLCRPGLVAHPLARGRHAKGSFCRASSCVIVKASCSRTFHTGVLKHREQPNGQTQRTME